MKRVLQKLAKRKKLLIIAGAALVALVLAGAGGLWWTSRNSPERLLYESIALDPFAGDPYTIEESANIKAGDVRFEAFFNKEGTFKAEGSLTCNATTETYGTLSMKASILQVNESGFLRFDEFAQSGTGDETAETDFNDFLNDRVIGKWVLVEDQDPTYLGYKEYGVVFTGAAAISNKLSSQEIADKLKESKSITILNHKQVSVAGKEATEYSLLLRKSAYGQFIDSVEPRFSYKDDILDAVFTDDTMEMTAVVDNKTKKLLSSGYSMENLCAQFLGQFASDIGSSLPEDMAIRGKTSPAGTAEKAEKPAEYLTLLEYLNLISEE